MEGSEVKLSYQYGKEKRLLTSTQYQNVFNNVRHKQSCKYFTFLCATNGISSTRLGLIIAKKHVPLAVNRNLIKRMVRETFRYSFTARTRLTPQADIIVLAKPAANKILNTTQLKQELNTQWLKIIQQWQNAQVS